MVATVGQRRERARVGGKEEEREGGRESLEGGGVFENISSGNQSGMAKMYRKFAHLKNGDFIQFSPP